MSLFGLKDVIQNCRWLRDEGCAVVRHYSVILQTHDIIDTVCSVSPMLCKSVQNTSVLRTRSTTPYSVCMIRCLYVKVPVNLA